MKSPVNAACIVGLYLFACEIAEYFLVRRRDSEVFPPKIGFRLLRWLGLAFCIAGILFSYKSLKWMLIFYIVLLVMWLRWPRTLLVDSSGVSSCSVFGKFRRVIPWPEVDQVSSDWQEERFRFWTFTGYTITVKSRYGSRIQHGLVNKDQARFLTRLGDLFHARCLTLASMNGSQMRLSPIPDATCLSKRGTRTDADLPRR